MDKRCGTYAGYRAHYERGETSCDKCREACKERRKKYTERANKYNKAYRLVNHEATLAYAKAYRVANPEKMKVQRSVWRKANPERRVADNNKRRAKRLGNKYEQYSKSEIFEAYGTNCYMCDMPINLEVSGRPGSNPQWRSGLNIEHFIDVAHGGDDTLENTRPSHAWCNLTKKRSLVV